MSLFSAPPSSQRWVFALTAIVTATAVPAHAQSVAPQSNAEETNAPVTAEAEEITGRPDREIQLNRNVELTRGQTRLTSDTACYQQVEDQVSAHGNVFMQRFGDRYTGDSLELNLSSGKGYLLKPTYKMQANNAQGGAARLDFISQEEAIVTNATYSTCEGLNPDWYLRANTLRLDAGRDVGVASGTVVYFKGVPILGTPALSFSLSGARRSGWLPPSVGFGSKGAAEVMVPYYVNIAPNRDLTLYPRLMLDRGLQLGATGRYMGETGAGFYGGETHLEFLINDKETKTDRWLVNSNHAQALAKGLSFGWNIRAASDDEYPSDFSKSISTSAERQLLREIRTDYISQYWSLTARAQNYQILQDPAAATDPSLTVVRPYDRLPQINFHAGRYDVNGFDWALDAELVRFSHPDFQTGNRAVAIPQVSYPFIRPGYFVTPKLMVHSSKYNVDTVGDSSRSLTRTLPTFSLDSGLIYERDSTLLGKSVTQTLEPRLFYVYTPYKDQSQFPLFDTAEAGFSFAQIFSENRFIGSDRVADANQVTAAITSRFIEENGSERLRLAIGQRYYLKDQRVQLDPNQLRKDRRSDLLVAASGRIDDNWAFDSAVQYDASAKQTFSSNYGLQWRPGDKKVINAEYRYLRDTFKNIDLSSQWPLSLRWYGVGRVSYSVKDHKILESLLGLEYRADCWVFRMGAQRFVTTLRNTSTPIFFQLELNGLSKLGFGNPLESFYKSIPGYSRLNPGYGR